MPTRAKPGQATQWIFDHLGYQGDYCLIWPFARDDKGYGICGNKKFGNDGGPRKVHRVICEMVNGPAPSPHYEAAHSCGNGHRGCANPQHISWKTRSANQIDRRRHGTKPNAVWGRNGKLTAIQVLEIRRLRGVKTEKELAAMFSVTPTNINKIHNRQRWKNIA